MNREDIFEAVKNALVEIGVEPEKITDSASISDDLTVDSLEIIEIGMMVEQTIDIQIDASKIDPSWTVGEFVDHLLSLKGGA